MDIYEHPIRETAADITVVSADKRSPHLSFAQVIVDEQGIVIVTLAAGITLNLNEIHTLVQVARSKLHEKYFIHPFRVMLILKGPIKITQEVRAKYAVPLETDQIQAVAVIVSSKSNAILVETILQLMRQTQRVRVFGSFEPALRWLRQIANGNSNETIELSTSPLHNQLKTSISRRPVNRYLLSLSRAKILHTAMIIGILIMPIIGVITHFFASSRLTTLSSIVSHFILAVIILLLSYRARTIIYGIIGQQQLDVENSTKRAETIADAVTRFSRGEFNLSIQSFSDEDIMTTLMLGIEMLGEELRASMVSRETLTNSLHAIKDCAVIVDHDFIISFGNCAFARLMGVSTEELVGHSIFSLLPSEQMSLLPLNSGVSNAPVIESEIDILHGNTSIPVQCIITSIRHNDSIDGYVFFLRDLRQQRAAEQEKEELTNQLVQSWKLASLGTMAAGIAHEINNPLAIVKGALGLLQEGILDPDSEKDRIERAMKAIDRMEKVVEHMRVFSHENSTSTRKKIDLAAPITDAFLLFGNQLRTLNIYFFMDIQEELFIEGDQTEIETVFQNLITNSRDAFEEVNDGRRRQIAVRGSHVSNRVVLTFEDNALGISKVNIDRIFDPFFSTKSAGKGTGLGLALVFHIVHEHGGTIQLNSKHDAGTTFTLSFPALF